MRAKLLKKVRKRYVIFKVERIGRLAPKRDIMWAKDVGLPFYKLVDTKDQYGFLTYYSSELNTLLKIMLIYIRYDYGKVDKPKNILSKSEKVWWNK